MFEYFSGLQETVNTQGTVNNHAFSQWIHEEAARQAALLSIQNLHGAKKEYINEKILLLLED